MFPELPAEGRFISAYTPETQLYLVDPEDIGNFGFAAFSNPERFGGKGIDAAVELLGVQEIAEAMERVSGKRVEVTFRSQEEIDAQIDMNPLIMGQVIMRKTPSWVHLEAVDHGGSHCIPSSNFWRRRIVCKEVLEKQLKEQVEAN
jgi:hypothetical protein